MNASTRLSLLQLAIGHAHTQNGSITTDAAGIVSAAALFEDFVTTGKDPRVVAKEDFVKSELSKGQSEDEEPLVPFTVDAQGKVDCADPDVTGAVDIEDAMLSKYTDILGSVLHDGLTGFVGGGSVMDLLRVGPIGIGQGPFTADEKNKILKVLMQVQKDFDVDLGVSEGDSFCDNCNNIHPALDFDNPVAMMETLREALSKRGASVGGLRSFAEFLADLSAPTGQMPTPDRLSQLKEALQKKMGNSGFEVATHTIILRPGETPEQGIARHLKANPIAGIEVGPNGELPPGVIKLDDSTRH